MFSSIRSNGGFVLLEAAVALLIVSMAAVATLSLASAEYRTAGQAERLLEASALAAGQLDEVRLLPVDALSSLPDSIGKGHFERPFEGYAWKTSARLVPSERHLFDVVVEVSWGGGSYELRTRLYRPQEVPRAALK